MKEHLIDPPFCLIPDQKTAKQKFAELLKQTSAPQPYLFLYQKNNFRSICWLDSPDKDKTSYILPAFGTHNDTVLFFEEEKRIPLKEGSFFYCYGEHFIVLKNRKRGFYLKQIAIINSETLLSCIAEEHGVEQYEFVLCKAYDVNPKKTNVFYVWSGWYHDEEKKCQFRLTIPVFMKDNNTVKQCNPWDLHYEALSVGQVFRYNDHNYIVKSDAGGIYIDDSVMQFLP